MDVTFIILYKVHSWENQTDPNLKDWHSCLHNLEKSGEAIFDIYIGSWLMGLTISFIRLIDKDPIIHLRPKNHTISILNWCILFLSGGRVSASIIMITLFVNTMAGSIKISTLKIWQFYRRPATFQGRWVWSSTREVMFCFFNRGECQLPDAFYRNPDRKYFS